MRHEAAGSRSDRRGGSRGVPELPGALAALMMLVALPAVAVEIPWAPEQSVSSLAPGARAVAAADIDGDGDTDFVTASADNDTIAWFENDGSESFSRRVIFDAADGASAVAIGDVDGDGDLDVMFASELDDTVGWAKNLGTTPIVWTVHELSVDPDGTGPGQGDFDGPRSVAAADLDSDGDIDVVAVSYLDDKVAWYENRLGEATADFTLRGIGLPYDAPVSVAAGDLDGDGDPDLAVAPSGGTGYLWYENDGSPVDGGWTAHDLSQTQDPNWVDIADIDGDGALDVVGTSLTSGVTWYQSATSTERVVSSQADLVGAVAVDMDRDGDIDVLRFTDQDEWGWDENDGSPADGGWTARPTSGTVLAAAAVAADVDGDGDRDVVSVGGSAVSWFENLTIHRSATFPQRTTVWETSLRVSLSDLKSGDVDGDGDPDLIAQASVFTSEGFPSLSWYENGGSGWSEHLIVSGGSNAFVAADLDRDGDLDIVRHGSSQGILWLENGGSPTSGAGNWTARQINASDTASSLRVADLDRDGHLDVVATTIDSGEIGFRWYQSDGTPIDGGWLRHEILQPGESSNGSEEASIADIDSDGDPDVFVGNSPSALGETSSVWFENDGTPGDGGWTWHSIHDVNPPFAHNSAQAADMDGDGDWDLLSASEGHTGFAVIYPDQIAWFENDGTPATGLWSMHFVRLTSPRAGKGIGSVRAHDLDQDGDLDVVVQVDDQFEGTPAVRWYENLGGLFYDHEISVLDHAAVSDVADLDGDGDLDIASGHNPSSGAEAIGWHENRGGQFALTTFDTAQRVIVGGQTEDVFEIEVAHLGRTGDGDLELESVEMRFETAGGLPLWDSEIAALIASYGVYVDNGSGAFEPALDTVVPALVPPSSPDSGIRVLRFFDDDPLVQVPWGQAKKFFLAVKPTPDAASQSPSSFRLSHLTETTSTALDRDHDIPLELEFAPDTRSEVIHTVLDSTSCTAPFDLNLESTDVTTSLLCEAGTELTAGPAFRILGGAVAIFRAGAGIALENGVEVQADGSFTAEIDPLLLP